MSMTEPDDERQRLREEITARARQTIAAGKVLVLTAAETRALFAPDDFSEPLESVSGPAASDSTQPALTEKDYQIRWLIRRDVAQVLVVDEASFVDCWKEADLLEQLRQRNCVALVAEHTATQIILGYIIYELHKDTLRIIRLAVYPQHRRQGIAARMVQRIKNIMSTRGVRAILLDINEQNLPGQLFCRSQDFRGEYRDDAIRFRYSVRIPQAD